MKLKSHRQLRDMLVLAMLGALMFAGKQVFEAFPNVHPIGMLLITYTVVYRSRALIPLYIFIFIEGAFSGFNLWWYPYLYIWLPLWGMAMLLPKSMKPAAAAVAYPLICALHGLMYGTLYSPYQAVVFHYDFATTLKWIAQGFPWDMIHAASNLGMGLLVYPLSRVLKKLDRIGVKE